MTTTFESQRAALADVVAIPVTPFAEDGTVDQAAHRALLRRLLDAGVDSITTNRVDVLLAVRDRSSRS